MPTPTPSKKEQIFLNVPYDASYEKLLIALVAVTVSHGAIPRMTLEVPDQGQGRMKKLYALLSSCDASLHDLKEANLTEDLFEVGVFRDLLALAIDQAQEMKLVS